jgi:hypothetical protein
MNFKSTRPSELTINICDDSLTKHFANIAHQYIKLDKGSLYYMGIYYISISNKMVIYFMESS